MKFWLQTQSDQRLWRQAETSLLWLSENMGVFGVSAGNIITVFALCGRSGTDRDICSEERREVPVLILKTCFCSQLLICWLEAFSLNPPAERSRPRPFPPLWRRRFPLGRDISTRHMDELSAAVKICSWGRKISVIFSYFCWNSTSAALHYSPPVSRSQLTCSHQPLKPDFIFKLTQFLHDYLILCPLCHLLLLHILCYSLNWQLLCPHIV